MLYLWWLIYKGVLIMKMINKLIVLVIVSVLLLGVCGVSVIDFKENILIFFKVGDVIVVDIMKKIGKD